MILVDTSIWIDHLRLSNPQLQKRLEQELVAGHPFVVGELACGNLRNRTEILSLFQALPAAPLASHDEVLHFIEREKLIGRGLGWVDVHLLASARLMAGKLWTRDKALSIAARELGIASNPQ